MTIQQHKQLLKRVHIILVFLGASLALVSYLLFLNIRTLGVDASGNAQNSRLSCSIWLGRRGNFFVSASYLKTDSPDGWLYRDGKRVATFPLQAAYDANNDAYSISSYILPSYLYFELGTYTLKIQDKGKPTDCDGSVNTA